MALNGIYAALDSCLTGSYPNQQIDLYQAANSQPSLTNLLEALTLFGISGTYMVSGVRLSQAMDSVVLSGIGQFGIPGAAPANLSNVDVRLVATTPGATNKFELSFSITDPGWTFSKTFPVLPDCEIAQEALVVFQPSFLIGLPLGVPVFTARSGAGEQLNLFGQLACNGALTPYADMLAPWPLRLSGTVELPANPADSPAMNLTAISPSLTIAVLSTSIRQMGLEIVVANNLDADDWGRTAFSVLNLIGTLSIGTVDPIVGSVSTPLLASSFMWRLIVEFDDKAAPLSGGIQAIADFLGLPSDFLLAPIGFLDYTGFCVIQIEVGIVPSSFSVDHIAVTLGSSKVWDPPIPFVTFTDVGTRWLLGWTGSNTGPSQYISGCVYGTLVIGGVGEPKLVSGPLLREPRAEANDAKVANSFMLDVMALIPQFYVTGHLREAVEIPIGDAFTYFFGDPGPFTKTGMMLEALDIEADPQQQTYSAEAVLSMDWSVPLVGSVVINLTSLQFFIEVNQGSVSGGITGEFIIPQSQTPGDPQPTFLVSAEYTGSNSPTGWIFTGELYATTDLDIIHFITSFLGISPPSGVPLNLTLEGLYLRFETGTQEYIVRGTVVGRWTPTLFGMAIPISASASIDAHGNPTTGAQGWLEGRFSINKFAVSAGMDIGVANPTYQFKIEFGDLWLTAITGLRGTAPNQHQIITIQLGGTTVGGILEYLVNLAAPTIGFRLDTPWDLLNRIELSRFLFTVDPTDNSIDFVYQANADLFFMTLDTIGVRYRRTNGEPVVELLLTGKFLDQVYDSGNELKWDVISDPPPALPGEGTSLLDLRYLGIGQRVTLSGTLPDTVRETLDRLRKDMQPPEDPNINPLDQPSGSALKFAADSQWLIGLDVTVMDTVTLGLIFNDPRLYGLSIGLDGERAGSLAGLKFEILYKKITNDIGMFRIELQVPEAFRHIELGEVSITLGIIVVEIYTNGNFMLDLGFPYNRNFDRSFTVSVFPFIGRGGFYFGVLNGSTSRRVPQITNGNFAPVLELGIGIAVGVGKEISVGPLSGGVYVQVEVIFQGVLAWFNPSGSGTSSSMYYWGQGIAAIHGKLYGKIDFVIIKVSATVEAYAQASVIFESHKPTLFRLNVGVSVEAEVEFLFFSISFHFDATLDVSFEVGSETPTPWILATGQGSQTFGRVRNNILPPLVRNPQRRAELLRREHLRSIRQSGRMANAGDYVLDWNATLPVFATTPRKPAMVMSPGFSITQIPVAWSGAAPPNPTPQYRVAFLLFAPNGLTVGAKTRTYDESAQATGIEPLALDSFIEGFLRWSISAITGSPGNDSQAMITAGQLNLLAEQMTMPETQAAFAIGQLAQFFGTNLHLQLSGDPGGNPTKKGGTIFPIPPFLNWTSPQIGSQDFSQYKAVGPLYQWGVSQYTAQFFPLDSPLGPPPVDNPTDYHSYATYPFQDWCLMVARETVKAARDAMKNWSILVTTSASLQDVANEFPTTTIQYMVRAGDTLDSVALFLGATPDELKSLNANLAQQLATAAAGSMLAIILGVTPETVAFDNASVTLTPNVALDLGTIDYQVSQTDTLSAIASRFNLSGAGALFSSNKLADDHKLLRAGSQVPIPISTFTPTTLTALQIAAIFFVRYFPDFEIPYTGWYAQTIFELNSSSFSNDFAWTIPVGTALKIPTTLNDTDPTKTFTYTTLPGDTFLRIGAAFSLAENFGTSATEPVATWATFRDAVQPVGQGFSIPASSVSIQPGESVNLFGERTLIHAGDLSGLLGWIQGVPILNPLALISVPGVAAMSGVDGATLSALATRFALTVESLGHRIANIAIFPGTSSSPVALTITHLLVQGTDKVVANVLSGETPAQISGLVSRYMLSGLQLPAPVLVGGHEEATGFLTSLYDLTGQQATGPTPDPSQPTVEALQVTVSVAGASWITLLDSLTVREGQTLDDLLKLAPDLLKLNPGLTEAGRLQPGMIINTGTVNSLQFSYTNQDLIDNYPATSLLVSPVSGPVAIALAGKNPRTYGLDHRVDLQSPMILPIPVAGTQPITGNVSLWPFSDAVTTLARAATATPYDIVLDASRPDGNAQTDTVQSSTYATLLPFTVRRLEGREGVYELEGVDSGHRNLLVSLWKYLSASTPPPSGTQAFLTVSPAPNAGNPNGLTIIATNNDATYLLKTNGSTDTVMAQREWNEGTIGTNVTSQFFSSFSNLASFLLLLWEGSVVGGRGYYLGFTDINGEPIPATAFDQHGNATLNLLVIVGEQQQIAPNGRPFLTFNNCALIAPGLNPTATSVYLEAATHTDLVSTSVVPQGSVGFTLDLPLPTSSDPATLRLLNLFSLASYGVPASVNDPFAMPTVGLPVFPQYKDSLQQPPWERVREERWRRAGREFDQPGSSQKVWRFEQLFPISRFGPASAAPVVLGLPSPKLDPYRGIGNTTLQTPLVQLGFVDVLGNVTIPPTGTNPPGSLPVNVGYIDPILGVGGWPATTTSYLPSGSGSSVLLSATVSPQPASWMPAVGQAPQTVIDGVTKQADKYAEAYFQLIQPGITASIVTNLNQDANGNPIPIATDETSLWLYTAAAYLATSAAASLQPIPASGTLQTIVQTYGFSYDDLARANADQTIASAFGAPTPIIVPAYVVFADNDTADSIVANALPGWPTPLTGTDLLKLSQNASTLPLRVGSVLALPGVSITVPSILPTIDLDALATANGTTAAFLAIDNAASTTIITGGTSVSIDGVVVTTDTGSTGIKSFADIANAFQLAGVNVSVGDIGAAVGDIPGFLIANQVLTSQHYIVKDGETLASNESQTSISDLATNNHGLKNIFDAGALVYVGLFNPSPTTDATSEETLSEFANRYQCPLGLMLAANHALTVAANSRMVLPGTVATPSSGTVPYTIQVNDQLTAIASKFQGATALSIATANAAMPYTIAGSNTISVDNGAYSTPTVNGDSFASVLARLQAQHSSITLSDIVQSIEGTSGYLATGGLLCCPLASIPGSGSVTVETASSAYGIDPVPFAQTNAGLLGLIAPSVGLTVTTESGVKSVTTGPNDTFNSIVSRFIVQGAQVGIADVLNANPIALLIQTGVVALLPPKPVTVSASIDATTTTFADVAFPLSLSVRIQRPFSVIDPEFVTAQHDGPVEIADTEVAALTTVEGIGKAQSQTLNAFSLAFRTSFPNLRLATGKVSDSVHDLWVVNFGSGGISGVTVTPGVTNPQGGKWPRFFGLRPLYNDLVARPGVLIAPLITTGSQAGTLSTSLTPTDYNGIDVEVWARRFLADVDLFLSAPYATGAYALAAAQSSLDTVLTQKLSLAASIAKGISPILDLTDPNASAGKVKAAEALRQQLASNLSQAYDTSAIVQYDATVSTTLAATRLVGVAQPKVATGSGNGDLPYTLTGAKVDLSQPTSFVSFLMRVPDPAYHQDVEVDLDLSILDLEFNIAGIPGVTGYESSDWLAFLPALSHSVIPPSLNTSLGKADVPIPLRAYPALPVVVGQSADATYKPMFGVPRSQGVAPSLSQAPLWTYGLTYSHEHAAQDEVFITATFNIVPFMGDDVGTLVVDVATELAKYIAVADDLWALLSGLADPATQISSTTLTQATETFATLVQNVATAWDAHWGLGEASEQQAVELVGTGPALQEFKFYAQISYLDDPAGQALFDKFTLNSLQSQPGPVGAWPNVFFVKPDRTRVPLKLGTSGSQTQVYDFPDNPAIPANTWPTIVIEWPNLNVTNFQNARGSLAVLRNEKLIGVATKPDFVYRTPSIEALDMVTPLNTWPQEIPIAGATLTIALQNAFTTLFGTQTGLPVTLGILYAYDVVPPNVSGDALSMYLPVSLYPNQQLGATTAADLAGAATTWQGLNNPATVDGKWAFSLVLYSNLDSTNTRALLSLEKLVYKM